MKALIVVALKAEFNDEITKDFTMVYTVIAPERHTTTSAQA